MSEQLGLTGDDTLIASSNQPPLTDRQQLAFDYVRERDGVTADEVGALLHAHRERRPHGVDDRCEWCARDGRSVLRSKALTPLVKYRLDRERGGRLYVVRDPEDRIRDEQPTREPTEDELAENPFAGLGVSSLDIARDRDATTGSEASNRFEHEAGGPG